MTDEPTDDGKFTEVPTATGELFYRLTFSQNLTLTPSVQWLSDPALNAGEDTVWVFGLRARLSL